LSAFSPAHKKEKQIDESPTQSYRNECYNRCLYTLTKLPFRNETVTIRFARKIMMARILPFPEGEIYFDAE
jgi:hypothetical protein